MLHYVIALILVAIISFLLGSIPCGVIIGKVFYGVDPRAGGSGSIGATNTNRVLGWKAGLATFLADVLKGSLAVAIARLIALSIGLQVGWTLDLLLILSSGFAILGHVFSPWLGFKGGKGISTGLGSLLVVSPLLALTVLGIFIVVVIFTRLISAGSIAAATMLPVFAFVYHRNSIPILVVSLLIAVAVDFAHRGNIKRIIDGTEPKFSVNRTHREDDDSDER